MLISIESILSILFLEKYFFLKFYQYSPYPKHRSARGASRPGELDPMANMMISPFFKSAAVILAKRAIAGLLNSATFSEFS